ncbi:2-oxoglutarate dehydrogenase E1 component [soil metagenome]
MEPFDFVNRANADFIDRLFEQYRKDPRSVSEQWQAFFAGFQSGVNRSEAASTDFAARAQVEPTVPLTMGVFDLVHTFREIGHFVAKLDPLGHDRPDHPLLHLDNFGMSDADLDRVVGRGSFYGPTNGTLRDLIDKLRQTYCRGIGVEFINISDRDQREWLLYRMEPILNRPKFSPEQRKKILYELIAAEEFEQYLHRAFIGAKRFSLEGGEALVPVLNTLVDHGATLGSEQMIMSMSHRGRLNVLAHVLNKPYESLLAEFMGTTAHTPEMGDGDVKYHLGYANERSLPEGLKAKVSLVPNPSHLELIDPIMQGIVRAKQQIFGDAGRARVVPIAMHGDAAFTGQGIVSETLNLSELHGYRTGGTIHIIVNNQIGFTTPPQQERFTPYATDIAKSIQAPIFHVNGDDPEACVHAAQLAIAFRQEFKQDVMIDLWCYRRHGHNEQDEPEFTQPVMYREIRNHKSVRALYAERLLSEGVVSEEELAQMKELVLSRLNSARKLAEEVRPRAKLPGFGGVWKGLGRAGADWGSKSAVTHDTLRRVAESQTKFPDGYTVHPKLARQLATRFEAVKTGVGIDWGNGEMLAIGSLLLEGVPVRFTGQDVERGTFSHRHAVLHDYNDGSIYIPLAHLDAKQAQFSIINTMLSELAVLGYEWGFASADPRNLVVWEAQFGDFVNGAQPIIDQILASAESKWNYMNGMVMLLPHGYEGQGPEHSNAYIERFLSLCAEDNMQVIIPTTPAQYFHALRRQIHRKFRKPAVLMMPKALLRYEPSSSSIEEFTNGSFQLAIDDARVTDPHRVRRVVLCSGKVFYTLLSAREKQDAARRDDVALVRVEQLYPFPQKEIAAALARYPRKQEVVWAQEEPKNRGAWSFMSPRLAAMLPDNVVLTYVGREEAASPATGSIKVHQSEEREIVAAALELPPQSSTAHEATKPGTAATANSPTLVSG